MVKAVVASQVKGFVEFIRERGVVGLAIGFVLGGAVQKVVTALVSDIVNPLLSLVLGSTDRFETFHIGPFLIGDFISVFIDFLILAAIIFFVFRSIGLEKLDKKKDDDISRREFLEKLSVIMKEER